jgi:hypothetical protein
MSTSTAFDRIGKKIAEIGPEEKVIYEDASGREYTKKGGAKAEVFDYYEVPDVKQIALDLCEKFEFDAHLEKIEKGIIEFWGSSGRSASRRKAIYVFGTRSWVRVRWNTTCQYIVEVTEDFFSLEEFHKYSKVLLMLLRIPRYGETTGSVKGYDSYSEFPQLEEKIAELLNDY